MTQHYRHHADRIVQNCRQALRETQDETAGNDNHNLLALPIESAINTAIFTGAEALTDPIKDCAASTHEHSGHFDSPSDCGTFRFQTGPRVVMPDADLEPLRGVIQG